MAAAAILDFKNFKFFNGRGGLEGRTASSFQISSKSVQPQLKYGDFSIFQDGGRRHLGFSKFQIFKGGDGQEGRTTSPRQISLKLAQTRPRYVSFNVMLVWLENAYSRPFLGSFWGTFPPNDITHRPNPKKDRPWAEPRHLSHRGLNRENGSRGSSWACERKGQDRTGQVTIWLYFTYLWRSPH